MRTIRNILMLSVAAMLVIAPVGFAHAVDAHHPKQGNAVKQAKPAKKKLKTIKKSQAEPRPHLISIAPLKRA